MAQKGSGSHTPKSRQSTPAVYVEQEWQKTGSPAADDGLDWAAADREDPEEWECVACGKTFRSEAAWNSHERSKKHAKEIERLKREMLQDHEELGLEIDDDAGPAEAPPPTPPETGPVSVEDVPDHVSEAESDPKVTPAETETEHKDQDQPDKVEMSKRDKRRLREASRAVQQSPQVCCPLPCSSRYQSNIRLATCADNLLTAGQNYSRTFARLAMPLQSQKTTSRPNTTNEVRRIGNRCRYNSSLPHQLRNIFRWILRLRKSQQSVALVSKPVIPSRKTRTASGFVYICD